MNYRNVYFKSQNRNKREIYIEREGGYIDRGIDRDKENTYHNYK